MTEIYRTLIIKRRLCKLKSEEAEALRRITPRLDALGNLYARGYCIEPPDLQKRFINEFRYFKNELKFGTRPKRWFCKIHPILNVQVRLGKERDLGCGVFIDIPGKILRLRGFINRRAITIQLLDSEIDYIKERLSENARIKLARVWIDNKYLYIALTFAKEITQPYDPESILAIDVNSWKHGITWGLIKNGRLIAWSKERPNLYYLDNLYNKTIKLEHKLGKLRRLGLKSSKEYTKLRKEAKAHRSKLYRYLRDYVNKLVHKFIVKALRNRSKIVIDDVLEESRRQLLEELLDNGLAKIYLAYLRRFVKLLENQARWYGIPIEKMRLPSRICPKCRIEMIENGHRKLKCPKCGQEYDRDLVPILHAKEILNSII